MDPSINEKPNIFDFALIPKTDEEKINQERENFDLANGFASELVFGLQSILDPNSAVTDDDSFDTSSPSIMEILENKISKTTRPATSQHIELPDDIRDLGDLYVRLYTKHPSLKNEILKMYQLDRLIEQKNQEYNELCKKRDSKSQEIIPTVPKSKPSKLEIARKKRIYTAHNDLLTSRKQIAVPVIERKIKSAAVSDNQLKENDQDAICEEVEMTEEELERVEKLLQEDVKESQLGYTPDKDTEERLQDINDKLKTFTPKNDVENSGHLDSIKDLINNTDIQVAEESDAKTLTLDLQQWGYSLNEKLHLQDIDNKLKVLKERNEPLENLSEGEMQTLIEECIKYLNIKKESSDANSNTLEAKGMMESLNSDNWVLSEETPENLQNLDTTEEVQSSH